MQSQSDKSIWEDSFRCSKRVDLFFSTFYLIRRALSLVYIQLFPP
jgi:hypothetical protein